MLWTLFVITFARAEYRAFELVITNSATGQERVEISTLDPNQYRAYHPVKIDEKVQYRATWRCRGNTSKKPVCSRPENTSPPPSLDQNTPR